jgi:signal transduction histidine kinase
VIIVDDNADFAENIAEIIGPSGYDVAVVGSCAEALKQAQTGFDVALVDLRLPDGDGTVLAARLREMSPHGEVVLLTGFGTVETAAAAVRAGAYAYLLKPCRTEELLLTLEQALRQSRLRADKRELARRAELAERLATAGRLTAGLSHEIRNPLNAAGLQLAVLERRIRKLGHTDQPSLLEPVRLVQDEIKRLDHILEDFLRLARPVDVSPVPIDVNEVIGKVLGLLQEAAERRGVALEAARGEVPMVRADPGRFQQVLLNLVLNAVDAAAPNGMVRISSWLETRQVCVAVDDTGPGIAPELRDRIFEPFFTTKPTGSGLGLSIVHSIIRQHGGSIEVGEGPLGGGARFLVRLPVG